MVKHELAVGECEPQIRNLLVGDCMNREELKIERAAVEQERMGLAAKDAYRNLNHNLNHSRPTHSL